MDGAREHLLIIETPEGVRFSLPLASPATRFLALTVDLAIIYALFIAITVGVSLLGVISHDIAGVVLILGYFVISIGYFLVCEWMWRGQTVGKRMLNLRVVDARGLRLETDQIILRNLLRFVDSLPVFYFLGGAVSLFSRQSQRLGDLAAGTVVVRRRAERQPDLSRLAENRFNSLREHPHVEAQLRQRVSPELAQLAFQALVRREALEPLARVKLFAELASQFREIAPIPEDLGFGLSDEQHVRNCVECIYREQKAYTPTPQETGRRGDSNEVSLTHPK